MGCIWSSKKIPSVPTCIEGTKEMQKKVRERTNYLLSLIRTPDISKEKKMIYLVQVKRAKGLELALLNMQLTLENQCITKDIVQLFKKNRDTLREMSKKCGPDEVRDLMNELNDMTLDLEESMDCMADVGTVIEDDALEKELQDLENIEPQLPPTPTHELTAHSNSQEKKALLKAASA